MKASIGEEIRCILDAWALHSRGAILSDPTTATPWKSDEVKRDVNFKM